MLSDKSLTQLRGIAQSLDIPNIFQKDKAHLIQAIELKQSASIPLPAIDIPKPEYDARLMTKPPSKKSEVTEIEKLLAPYVERGLKVRFEDERWFFSYNKKTDEGTLRMPMRQVLRCAEKLLK